MPDAAPLHAARLSGTEGAEAFHRGFVDEHLALLDFLIAKRRYDLLNPGCPWTALERVDHRCRRHVLALKALGRQARRVCLDLLSGDDDGERVASASVLTAVADMPSDLVPVLAALGAADVSVRETYVQTLRWMPPPDPRGLFEPYLRNAPDGHQEIAARVLADCETLEPDVACELSSSEHAGTRAAALNALVRNPTVAVLSCLRQALGSADLPRAALTPLLLLRETRTEAARVLAWDPTSPPPSWLPCLVLLEPHEVGYVPTDELMAGLSVWGPAEDLVQAIGVRGDGRCIAPLIAMLQDSSGNDDAAPSSGILRQVLRRITGGFDLGVAWRTPEFAESALRDATADVFTRCLEASADAWKTWWQDQGQTAFVEDGRYRYGQPRHAGDAVAELLHPGACAGHRRLAAIEHGFRAGVPFPFEPDWAVARQHARIRSATAEGEETERGTTFSRADHAQSHWNLESN